jgi:hypothetical protein
MSPCHVRAPRRRRAPRDTLFGEDPGSTPGQSVAPPLCGPSFCGRGRGRSWEVVGGRGGAREAVGGAAGVAAAERARGARLFCSPLPGDAAPPRQGPAGMRPNDQRHSTSSNKTATQPQTSPRSSLTLALKPQPARHLGRRRRVRGGQVSRAVGLARRRGWAGWGGGEGWRSRAGRWRIGAARPAGGAGVIGRFERGGCRGRGRGRGRSAARRPHAALARPSPGRWGGL